MSTTTLQAIQRAIIYTPGIRTSVVRSIGGERYSWTVDGLSPERIADLEAAGDFWALPYVTTGMRCSDGFGGMLVWASATKATVVRVRRDAQGVVIGYECSNDWKGWSAVEQYPVRTWLAQMGVPDVM